MSGLCDRGDLESAVQLAYSRPTKDAGAKTDHDWWRRFEAFSAAHSIRAPAVGYRVSAGGSRFFYIPDVVAIRDRRRALQGVDLYVGDGATIKRPLVRRRERALIGHSSIRAQLDWCKKERIAIAVFTHCGTEIVTADARQVSRVVRRLGVARGVDARIARDGLRLTVGQFPSCGSIPWDETPPRAAGSSVSNRAL